MNYVLIRNGMYHDPLTDLGGATDEGLLSLANDVLDVSGVVNYTGGDLLIEQQASPNMTVKSRSGRLWIKNDGWTANTRNVSKFFPCLFTASENLTIDANSSGSTRYDLICAKINLAIDPGDDGEFAVTRVVVKGTAGAGVPATPANHYKLAEIQIIDGATSIPTAKITDRRNQVQFNSVFATAPTAQVIGSLIAGATNKTTPVDADMIGLSDSATGNILNKLTWANLKATLKTYFDSLTTTLTNKTLTSPKINEDVALTATATVLNNLTGKTLNLGSWTTFTPSWTNLTVGNATNIGRYCVIGKTVFVTIRLIFGSTTSVSGFFGFTLPVTASLPDYRSHYGKGTVFDSSAGSILMVKARADSSTFSSLIILTAGGTYVSVADTSVTIPFTWATSDMVNLDLIYEAA